MTVTLIEKESEPILINNLTWREFKVVAQLLEGPGVRLWFLDGLLEIRKTHGKKYQTIKERIGALLEIYLEFIGIDFTPTGSMTLENEAEKVKIEADESYEIGLNKDFPDLVIEVTVSSGGINKLEAYKRLQIPEVWFWENGKLSFYILQNKRYKNSERSLLLPDLDVELLRRCINISSHTESLREFRKGIEN